MRNEKKRRSLVALFDERLALKIKHSICAICCWSLISVTAFAESQEKTFDLGGAGVLKISVPASWTAESDDRTLPTLHFKAGVGKHVILQVTALKSDSLDEGKLKDAAQLVAEHNADGSVEKKAKLEELKGKQVHGYVSSFTDASGDPGEFKYITAGILVSGKTALAVTLLYNDKTSTDQDAAMAMLRSIQVEAASAQQKQLVVKSPDGTWSLTVPGHWKVAEESSSKDRKSKEVTASSGDGSIMLTLFLEPAGTKGTDASAVRSFYLNRMKQNPIPMEHLKQSQVGDAAVLEYDHGSDGFMEHSMHAYLVHAGTWVDLHVSKSDFAEKTDRAAFEELLNGFKVE